MAKDRYGRVIAGGRGVAGINDKSVIAAALITGNTIVRPGTFLWKSLECLQVPDETLLMGSGIDNTIFKLSDGLLSDARPVIDLGSYSSIENCTIDGNARNNTDASWTLLAHIPAAWGIYTSKNVSNGSVYSASTGANVRRVRVFDCLRSCIVLTGYDHSLDNIYLQDCSFDHLLYASNAYRSTCKNMWLSGKSAEAQIIIGSSNSEPAIGNIFENLHFHDQIDAVVPWGVALEYLIDTRTVAAGHDNVISNVDADINLSHVGFISDRGTDNQYVACKCKWSSVSKTILCRLSNGRTKLTGLELTINNGTVSGTGGRHMIYAENGSFEIINMKLMNDDPDTTYGGITLVSSTGATIATMSGIVKVGSHPLKLYPDTNPIYIIRNDVGYIGGTTEYISGSQYLIRYFIKSGETKSFSGIILSLTQDAFNSLDCPFNRDVIINEITVNVSTGATVTAPNIDCGVGSSATTDYTNLFDDLPGETIGLYNSKIATPGTQTQPILWQTGAGNRYLNMSIKDAAATGMVATYVVTVIGL